MTLDPVHVEGIARLAGRLGDRVEDADHQDLAETAWTEFLDPLYRDGDPVVEPLDEQCRRAAPLPDVALAERPFDTQHGLDSGTINPTTFKNGLVLDVAQAAMAGVPSALDLHRERTVVVSAHTNDQRQSLGQDAWEQDDEGYTHTRLLEVPRVDRYAQTVVHALALYLAESHHALEHASEVEDLLILDGPIYPTGLLAWADRHPELADLLEGDKRPRDVVENYVRLVEQFVERDVPLVGFVKNSAANGLIRAIREQATAPWANDNAFFEHVLSRTEAGDLRTDAITYTNWFHSRVGTDRPLSTAGNALGIDRHLDPEAYEVTFFALFDPRDELVYRVEAPYAVTRDPDRRERLARQIVADVAAERGPPLAVAKADELARIGVTGKQQLRDRIGQEFEVDRQRSYNDRRWGADYETDGPVTES
ncbi:DNA double-strand break repair nuclease NurA [Halorhabdus sp. CBA1104]|uniref:DNA double-strand break repair nuclease NurA n=1 Tax=unclassified Halorhabdus TaxID=2621901 RepID=UPI0012B2BC30|nr:MULTISPECIES: DNA double-strand break repair nuclease NurA [unclassified Halorhabdus]QGN06374.1 DNA double-strand break repair nuclease NurA [Halorhabdus sp. CBA1104]